MDDILLASDSDSDDEPQLDGKVTTVSSVAAIVQKEQEKQAAAEAAAKFQKEQERREQEAQRKRQREIQLKHQQQMQLQKQQQEALAKKEKERQAASAAAAAAEAKRKASMSNPMNIGIPPSSYPPPSNIAPSNKNTTDPMGSSNPNAKLSYGMHGSTIPNNHSRPNTHNHPSSSHAQIPNTSKQMSVSGIAPSMDMGAFEPTPLSNLMKPRPSNQSSIASKPTATNSMAPANTHSQHTTSSSSKSTQQSSHHHHRSKSEKEHFLMFTKVLMKYLEQKNPEMNLRAKAVIRECAEKNKQKDPKYASLTKAMQKRLHETVGPEYWRKAHDYLNHFLKQNKLKAEKKAAAAAAVAKPSSNATKQPTHLHPSSIKQSVIQPQTNTQSMPQQHQQPPPMQPSQMPPHSRTQPPMPGIQTSQGVKTNQMPSFTPPPTSSLKVANPMQRMMPQPPPQNQSQTQIPGVGTSMMPNMPPSSAPNNPAIPKPISSIPKPYQPPPQGTTPGPTTYIPPTSLMKKQTKPKPMKKAQNIKPTVGSNMKNMKSLNDNANKIIAEMTPAQHKAHMAARNAALGLDNSSNMSSMSTGPRTSTTTPTTNNPLLNTNARNIPPTNTMMPSSASAAAAAAAMHQQKLNQMNSSPFAKTNMTMPAGKKKNTPMPPNMGKPNMGMIPTPNMAMASTGKGGVGTIRPNMPPMHTVPPSSMIHHTVGTPTIPVTSPPGVPASVSKKIQSSKTKPKKGLGLDDVDKMKGKGPIPSALMPASMKAGYGMPVQMMKVKMDSKSIKQYEELMEHLDHASLYDWKSAVSIVPKEILMEEQKSLLYSQKIVPDWAKLKTVTKPEISNTFVNNSNMPNTGIHTALNRNHWQMNTKGWGRTNVVSATTAWARLRLLEEEEEKHALLEEERLDMTKTNPPKFPSNIPSSPYSWFDEDKAEKDQALALLSEATQTFLKSLLEKAISSARQRHNLDGTRLWYAQKNRQNSYPLTLRLGCDVKRQIALAHGNAAKTCQRLEEALARSVPSSYDYTEEEDQKMLYLSTSMYDVSKYPAKLENASLQAETDAKRSFEIYGGKESHEPPFGRVPSKRCKLMVKDFKSSMTNASFPWKMKGISATSFI